VSEKHDTFSPSRLAQLENCLDWESAGCSDSASYGTLIHKLIYDIAMGHAIDCRQEDMETAIRALRWLGQHVGQDGEPLIFSHEVRFECVVPETGGTIDACAYDASSKTAIIVDWKAALPLASSMQGKAYALNYWTHLLRYGNPVESVRVWFYNYMNGEVIGASYNNKDSLERDIRCLIEDYYQQDDNRRSANPGCSYCKHRSSCKVAMSETTTALSITPDTAVMPLADLLSFYDQLKAVMKRAEALEAAAKERLMNAARAGELPGYTVKTKRGNKLEWTSEEEAIGVVQKILSDNFATAKVTGLLPPTQVNAALKAAGVSLAGEAEQQLSMVIRQNSYEILTKEKG